MQYKKQVEGTWCVLDCGTLWDREEAEKKMNHQRGGSEVLLEPFSGQKSEVMVISTWKFLSSWLGGYCQ